MMTRYCNGKTVKANKSLEQEVIRQRDVAELKTHVLKHKLLASKTANDHVHLPPPPLSPLPSPGSLPTPFPSRHTLDGPLVC